MPQKWGHRANETEAAQKAVPCQICDWDTPQFSWTDINGQGTCTRCGTPYKLVAREGDDPADLPIISIKPESIPILRQYWDETGKPNGLGGYMGWRDYPDEREYRIAFNAWDDARTKVAAGE